MADRTQRNDPFSTVNMANCCSSVDQFPQRAGKDASLVNPDLHGWVRWQCTFPERWAKCGDDTANTTRDLAGIIVGAHDDCCSINVGEMIDRQLRELGGDNAEGIIGISHLRLVRSVSILLQSGTLSTKLVVSNEAKRFPRFWNLASSAATTLARLTNTWGHC